MLWWMASLSRSAFDFSTTPQQEHRGQKGVAHDRKGGRSRPRITAIDPPQSRLDEAAGQQAQTRSNGEPCTKVSWGAGSSDCTPPATTLSGDGSSCPSAAAGGTSVAAGTGAPGTVHRSHQSVSKPDSTPLQRQKDQECDKLKERMQTWRLGGLFWVLQRGGPCGLQRGTRACHQLGRVPAKNTRSWASQPAHDAVKRVGEQHADEDANEDKRGQTRTCWAAPRSSPPPPCNHKPTDRRLR